MILKDSQEARAEAARTIRLGGIIAFRTDTFYGLGADPFNREALRKIRQLKGREEGKPILLLISDLSEVDRFIANQSETFKSVADRFWPGPITLIGRARSELPMELTAGTQTIGLRLPNDDNVRSLVRACGRALTATSANPSGGDAATTAAEVMDYFPTGIDLVLDGGTVTATHPSTVLDLSGEVPLLVREGAITREELARLSADFAD
ncbi:MAG: L-threonylcarbamoyladenylate synthase [Acidobacteriota bacterium]|nr:L-threonylcarbamoyladenylate synthase [Acidobacteriota bacterium]